MCGRRACIAQPAGVRRRCEGEWKCSEGGEKMLGVGADLRREWVVRSAGVHRRGAGERKCAGRE